MLGPLFSLSRVGTSLEMAVSSRRIMSLPKGMARSDERGAGWLCPCKVWIIFNQGQQSNDPKTELLAAESAAPREVNCAGRCLGAALASEVSLICWAGLGLLLQLLPGTRRPTRMG